MNLRQLAERDLGAILEDDVAGFGWAVKVTSPGGTVGAMVGFSSDVSAMIDPDTGLVVSGRSASVALRSATLFERFPRDGLPEAVADSTRRPWLVEFQDIHGKPHLFKVRSSNPDRTIGMVTCTLEVYTRVY